MQEEAGLLEEPSEIIVKTMAAGGKHSLVLGACGSLFTFGYGQQG